jgi:hypothetical protein
MTPEQLAEIEAREQAARPGPWHLANASDGDPIEYGPHWVVESAEDGEGEWTVSLEVGDQETGQFIAYARQDVPVLLGEVKRLQAKLDAPCGSCHPCSNYTAETWREAGRIPPRMEAWDELRAENARLRERITGLADAMKARAVKVVHADAYERGQAAGLHMAAKEIREIADAFKAGEVQ